MRRVEVVIIGSGFAGASVAWHLAELGMTDVVILEQEAYPGLHASGQNASIMRQFEEDPSIANYAFKSAGFVLTPPFNWKKIIDQVGSLILFGSDRYPKIKETLDRSIGQGLEAEIIDKKEASLIVPPLETAEFQYAVRTTTDGVVDINEYLWSYLRDVKLKGISLETNRTVLEIKKGATGEFLVTTEKETIFAKKIVNAAGAWAADIGKLAGALTVELIPYKRHLYTTTEMDSVRPDWPFVWDIDNQYYFRPESGGLLLGPCDEERSLPGVPGISHTARELLAEKLCSFCPSLANITIATEWAGLRTFAKDRRFVLGQDPTLKNFYWVAGLGGFGVTCSYMVGKSVAIEILNKELVQKEFRPDRFL